MNRLHSLIPAAIHDLDVCCAETIYPLCLKEIENNSPEQALLGDFTRAVDDAILDSGDAHQNQMMQLLADPKRAAGFARVVFDILRRSA